MLLTTAAPTSLSLGEPAPSSFLEAMNILRLLLVVALAFVFFITSASGKTCYFRDPCSRWRLLAGKPGDFLVDACGKTIVFSNTCLARRISSCRIKDSCAKQAVTAGKGAGKKGAKDAKSNKKGRAGKGAKKGAITNLIPRTFRGAVVKDGCNRPFRVSRTCKLIKISAACYKACHVMRIKVGRRYLLRPGTPYTCASRCR